MAATVRLAVSNIAWGAEEDDVIAPRLVAAGAEALEVAPARLFPDPARADKVEALALRKLWHDRGLPIVSLQALLFGRSDLQLFGQAEDRDLLEDHVAAIMSLGDWLGAGPLVFGSPGNRKKGDLSFAEARDIAVPVFRRLGDIAMKTGTVFCIEANASGYGCDFMTSIEEAAEVVAETNHPSVGLVVDTGNMAMAGDSAAAALGCAGLVRHLHLSRPDLAPLDSGDGFPRDVLDALRGAGYDGLATIEMRRVPDDPIAAVERAVHLAKGWIGG